MTDTGPTPNPEKDPVDWVTGEEPMTGPQASYCRRCVRSGRDFDPSLPKAQASERIDALQAKTGRGFSKARGRRLPGLSISAPGRARRRRRSVVAAGVAATKPRCSDRRRRSYGVVSAGGGGAMTVCVTTVGGVGWAG